MLSPSDFVTHLPQMIVPSGSTLICLLLSCTTRDIRPVPLTDVMAQPPRISQPMPIPMIREGMCPHQHHNQQWAVCPHSTTTSGRHPTCAYGLCIVACGHTTERGPIRSLTILPDLPTCALQIGPSSAMCWCGPIPPPTIGRHWRHTPKGRPWHLQTLARQHRFGPESIATMVVYNGPVGRRL